MRARHAVPLSVLSLTAVCVAAAGCGGAGKSPAVASLGSPATTTTAAAPGGFGGGGPSAGGNPGGHVGFSLRMNTGGNVASAAKFSRCMRSHGVPNFPDPSAQGDITINSSSGIDPSSSAFQSAQRTCRKLLPNGGQATPQQLAQAQRNLLRFSACMRSHGVADFPDPTGPQLKITGGPGSDLNPDSPTFQAAQKACQGDLPGTKGGPNARIGGR